MGFDEAYDHYETMLEANGIELEDLWLLVTGLLRKLDNEIKDARPLDDWRVYLRNL